jgi:CHAT domain-containing protein/tetratricopeptide (TPR) repeat protein
VLLLLVNQSARAQAPGAAPAPKQQEQLPERDRLAKQVEELRQTGKFDEAVPVAERVLDLERRPGAGMTPGVAEALSRLAELHELRGDWGRALEGRREALTVRLSVDGKDHWRTVDARLSVAFAEKVAGLGKRDQAKVASAVRKEQEAARLEGQGKSAESERVALEVLETYRAVVGPETAEVARVWHRIGRACLGSDDARRAKDANEQAVAIRRKVLPTSHPDLGRSLNNLGSAERTLGNNSRARELFAEAVRIWRASLGPSDTVTALGLNNLGTAQNDLHEYEAAKASHGEALAIRRKALPRDHPDIAHSLNNLGLVQSDLGDHAAAKRSDEEALAIRRKALPPGDPDIAWSLLALGNAQWNLREHAAAKASYQEALAIRRKALPPGHPDISDSLLGLGNVQSSLAEYAAAKASYEEALAIRRKAVPKDHPDIATSLLGLGNVQSSLGEYAAAKASYQEVLAIYRKALPKDHTDIATTLNNVGVMQRNLRDFAAAMQSFAEALAIRRKALPKDDLDVATILYNLGIARWQLRDFAAAKRTHEQALAIRRKELPKDHPDVAHSLNYLGNLQRDLREYAASMRSYQEALAILRKALPKDHPAIAGSLNDLGNLERELREYAASVRSYQEALAILRKALPEDQPAIAVILNNLGIAQSDLREYAAAKKSLEEALAIGRTALPEGHLGIAQSLLGLGWTGLKSGVDVRSVVPLLAEATDVYLADQIRLSVVQAEKEQLAIAVQARGCLHYLLAAVITARADPGHTYDRVVRVKGSVTTQQSWTRQTRDRADPDTTRLLTRFRDITKELAGQAVAGQTSEGSSGPPVVAARIRSLSDERALLERKLSARSEAFRSIQSRSRVGATEVRAALPEGAALVDIVDYLHVEARAKEQEGVFEEQRVVAFVVRPELQDVVIVPLGPSKELAELIDRWRTSFGVGKAPPGGASDPGAELRKRLWEPLAEHLHGVNTVLISPDGPLHGLPWAALPGSKPGTFLIHEHAFAVVPVPQLLPELMKASRRPAGEPPSLLLAGGIAFGEGKARDLAATDDKLPPVPVFGPLAGTESEVNDLDARFRRSFPMAQPPLVLSEDKATKQAVLAALPAHRFAHLATHGFFAAESATPAVDLVQRAEFLLGGMRLSAEAVGRHPGLLSGVVFAGVNLPARKPEETILTALEASEQDLGKVELVVLSACETGRGQVANGEGVLGLQRAFQLAGARSVVASLWRVPDEETHQLMREFYRRVWTEKPTSKAEALRQAQLWMLANWKPRGTLARPAPEGPPPPYYWAAFVLSGDWR